MAAPQWESPDQQTLWQLLAAQLSSVLGPDYVGDAELRFVFSPACVRLRDGRHTAAGHVRDMLATALPPLRSARPPSALVFGPVRLPPWRLLRRPLAACGNERGRLQVAGLATAAR